MLLKSFFNNRFNFYSFLAFFSVICFSNAFATEKTVIKAEVATNVKENKVITAVNPENPIVQEPKEEPKNNENTNTDTNIDINQIEENSNPRNFTNIATLQILNKNNSKTSVVTFNISKKQKFEDLNIVVYKCWKSPEYQKPEAKILVEIFEIQKDQSSNFKKTTQPQNNQDKRIFYGWLFASSPSVSSLEHSVYDVVAVSCK